MGVYLLSTVVCHCIAAPKKVNTESWLMIVEDRPLEKPLGFPFASKKQVVNGGRAL